jgi:putative intracellular protease/amidase
LEPLVSLFSKQLKNIFSKRRKKMKQFAIFLTLMTLVVSGVTSLESQVYGQSAGKVLMIPREGYSNDLDLMLKMEVGVMTILLKRAGFQVDVATTSGQPIIGPTEKIEKVSRLADIKLDDYAGVILPCMSVGQFPGPPVSPEAVGIVKRAVAEGKPVAAALWSGIILAEAGVLKGKKYALLRDPLKTDENFKLKDLRFEGAIYSGPGVVQDSKIITSGGCPWGERRLAVQNRTVELTQTFIKAIGAK